jgi:hypothetical protein
MVNDIIVQRQVNLIAMLQDEISIRIQDKKDPSMAMSALREAISLLKELMMLGIAEPVKTVAPPRTDNRRQEEYERDVRKQYEREESQKTLPPTQYIYNDGFHGVTLPNQQQSRSEIQHEPYVAETFLGASASRNSFQEAETFLGASASRNSFQEVEEKEYWDNE